jgi:sarcosine oxidase subunit gamma
VTAETLRHSPLASYAADLASFGATEAAFVPQWSLRVDPSVSPFPLPSEPNTWAAEGDRELLWLSPDEWLVVGGSPERLASALAGVGVHHSLVDVSCNRAVLDLSGTDRREHLSTGCGLDLDASRSWLPGMCAQTLLARVPVLLQERGDATRVFVRPSFAGYLVTWLARSRPST